MIAAILVFSVLILLGVSIYLSIGIASALLFVLDGESLSGYAQIVVDGLNSGTLMAAPFFVVAATFMSRGGIASLLIDAAKAWVGHFRGGLALVAILATTLFAAISGSSLATALAMGTLLVPEMVRQSYKRQFAVGLVGASGTLGILIPPSLAMIVYGVVAEQSVPELFLAGVVPGVLQAVMFAILAMYLAKGAMENDAPAIDRLPLRKALSQSRRALPALAVPALAMFAIYGGFVTVTEASVLTAALSVCLAVFVYKTITPRDVIAVMADAIRNCAGLIIIVGFSMALGHWLTLSRTPLALVQWVTSHDLEVWQFLLMMNLIMLLLGTMLEVLSVILITVPIVLPLLAAFGISPVHYGIILIVNMELALLTPPIGLNLFVLSGISKAPVGEVARGVLPFLAVLALLLIAVTFLPILSTGLPDLFFK